MRPNFVALIISGSIVVFKKEKINCLGSDNPFCLTAVSVINGVGTDLKFKQLTAILLLSFFHCRFWVELSQHKTQTKHFPSSFLQLPELLLALSSEIQVVYS